MPEESWDLEYVSAFKRNLLDYGDIIRNKKQNQLTSSNLGKSWMKELNPYKEVEISIKK